jgi:hypothetical protein
MNDYTWPSVYFSYLFFALSAGLTVFFCVRSWKDGQWKSEEAKYTVFEDEWGGLQPARDFSPATPEGTDATAKN